MNAELHAWGAGLTIVTDGAMAEISPALRDRIRQAIEVRLAGAIGDPLPSGASVSRTRVG